ncbi:MAG: flagellin, partial [Alishewanella agri]|nr:flagellin [Alishewanella agri]
MALYVNSNISALNAQRQLMNSGNALDTSFKRLSSGLRI